MSAELKWRLLALLALLLYAVVAMALVTIVLRNIVLALIIGPTLSLVAYAGWLLFTGVGKRAWRGAALLAIGGIVLLVEVVVFIRDVANVRALALAVVLSILYAAMVVVLRRQYWRVRRQRYLASGAVRAFQRPYLIINPKSGAGRAMKAHIDELARQKDIETLMMNKGDDMASLARQAVSDGADVIGVSGGDGSIGAVAQVAMENDLPIVVLPGGTRCHFARDIGLDPKRITDALTAFDGVERLVDVGDINGRIFLNNASFGLYADIVDKPEYRTHKIRVARRVLQDMMNGRRQAYKLHFRQGAQAYRSAVMVMIGVNRYEMLSVFELGHRQCLDGGVLQVTAVTALNEVLVKWLAGRLRMDRLAGRETSGDIKQWETKDFRIDSPDRRLVVGVDGEREVYDSPAIIRVRPSALRIFVPPEGVRPRPVSVFSISTVDRLSRALTGRLP